MRLNVIGSNFQVHKPKSTVTLIKDINCSTVQGDFDRFFTKFISLIDVICSRYLRNVKHKMFLKALHC